jgi:hypothetical protein
MPITRRLNDFVSLLRGFATEEAVTSSSALGLRLDTDIEGSSHSRCAHGQDLSHTRNLIHRDHVFEVMAAGWRRGLKTVLHTHNGQQLDG